MRYQRGHIWKENGCWFGRWREDVLGASGVVRRQRARKLADYSDRYRSVRDVRPLLDEILSKVNGPRSNPLGTMPLAQFFDTIYLPYVQREKRASTVKGYREIWRRHVRERIGMILVRDFRTVDGSHLLKEIAASNSLTKTTLQHIKSFVSGLFTYARNEGLYDGSNPMQGVLIPKAKPANETYAYSLPQIMAMLSVLEGTAKAVVTVAAFTGLRAAEIRGLEWPDFTGDEIMVCRSEWRGVVNPPKTPKSRASIPAIEPVRGVLESRRARMGNPSEGPIFPGVKNDRIDLEKLACRIVEPRIKAAGVPWHGWHAFRRGLASNLYQLGVTDKVVQAILRHSKVTVTRDLYIKTFGPDVAEAMSKLEDAIKTQRAVIVQ